MPAKQNPSSRRRDRERILFGTQGAASSVRHVDVALVDTYRVAFELLTRSSLAKPQRRDHQGPAP